jgi:MFS family permease
MLGLPSLSGLYLVAILCFAISTLLLATISSPGVPYFGKGAVLLGPRERERVTRGHVAAGLGARPARTALIILAVTNLVMVAIMAVTPVHMVLHGHALGLVGAVIGVHVAGMFVPSPVSGWAVDRVGPVTVAASGIFLLVGAGIAGALIDQGSAFWMTAFLAVPGIGWNCGVVGGSMLLAASVPTTLRPHVEGLGEVAMGLAAGAGAPVAGMVVAFGGFTTLSLAGAATAMLALMFVWK